MNVKGREGSLCKMVNYSSNLMEEHKAARLASWITETDVVEIRAIGFNSVRLLRRLVSVLHKQRYVSY